MSPRKLLVPLGVVVALATLGAATASAALPEFAGNVAGNRFTGQGGQLHISDVGSIYTCEKSVISGEVSGPKQVSHVKLTVQGCNTYFSCKSWTSQELKGTLGYIYTNNTVGLLLEPVSGPFVECGSKLFPYPKMTGSVIGREEGLLNHLGTNFSLNYSGLHGEQLPQKFAGETFTHNLEWMEGPSESLRRALEGSIGVTTEKSIEIRG